MTPAVVSAAEADYERNLANTVELIYLLTNDAEHGSHNKQLFSGWLEKHLALARDASTNLQPLWSQPRVKAMTYAEAADRANNRFRTIVGEIGLQAPSN